MVIYKKIRGVFTTLVVLFTNRIGRYTYNSSKGLKFSFSRRKIKKKKDNTEIKKNSKTLHYHIHTCLINITVSITKCFRWNSLVRFLYSFHLSCSKFAWEKDKILVESWTNRVADPVHFQPSRDSDPVNKNF